MKTTIKAVSLQSTIASTVEVFLRLAPLTYPFSGRTHSWSVTPETAKEKAVSPALLKVTQTYDKQTDFTICFKIEEAGMKRIDIQTISDWLYFADLVSSVYYMS